MVLSAGGDTQFDLLVLLLTKPKHAVYQLAQGRGWDFSLLTTQATPGPWTIFDPQAGTGAISVSRGGKVRGPHCVRGPTVVLWEAPWDLFCVVVCSPHAARCQ